MDLGRFVPVLLEPFRLRTHPFSGFSEVLNNNALGGSLFDGKHDVSDFNFSTTKRINFLAPPAKNAVDLHK